MNKKDNKEKIFNSFLIILFIIFLTTYITTNSNYYEYKMYEKTRITEDKIKEFESDVASGIDVDINNYIDNSSNDYSSKVSNISSKFSKYSSNFIKKGIRIVFDILKKYFS